VDYLFISEGGVNEAKNQSPNKEKEKTTWGGGGGVTLPHRTPAPMSFRVGLRILEGPISLQNKMLPEKVYG